MFSIFSMNFSRNNQNATILKIIKISRNCHGRFTADYSNFLAGHSIHREIWYNVRPTFLKIWQIWALAVLNPNLLFAAYSSTRTSIPCILMHIRYYNSHIAFHFTFLTTIQDYRSERQWLPRGQCITTHNVKQK